MKTTQNKVYYFFYQTRFGEALIASNSRGICFVSFPQKEDLSNEELQHLLSNNEIIKYADSLHQKVLDVINGKTKNGTNIPMDIIGTDFQQKVWQAVMQIPYGETATYNKIANMIGKPKASRAVGSAIGKNAISILIPCHRVICSSGKLGGYRWGTDIKKKILETENSNQAFR